MLFMQGVDEHKNSNIPLAAQLNFDAAEATRKYLKNFREYLWDTLYI